MRRGRWEQAATLLVTRGGRARHRPCNPSSRAGGRASRCPSSTTTLVPPPASGPRLTRAMPANDSARDASVPFEPTRVMPVITGERMIVGSGPMRRRPCGKAPHRFPMDGPTRDRVTAAAAIRCDGDATLVSGLGSGCGRRRRDGAHECASGSARCPRFVLPRRLTRAISCRLQVLPLATFNAQDIGLTCPIETG